MRRRAKELGKLAALLGPGSLSAGCLATVPVHEAAIQQLALQVSHHMLVRQRCCVWSVLNSDSPAAFESLMELSLVTLCILARQTQQAVYGTGHAISTACSDVNTD